MFGIEVPWISSAAAVVLNTFFFWGQMLLVDILSGWETLAVGCLPSSSKLSRNISKLLLCN